MRHTMHLRPGVAQQPNLELKTRPKQLLGSLPLVIALPRTREYFKCSEDLNQEVAVKVKFGLFYIRN
jgi:hypothetical protein